MVTFQSGSRRRALEYEKDIVHYWKENKTFEKSIELRPKEAAYVFYDGPPFISGVPHHGTLLSSIVKDAVPRYQTMQGRRVERVWGWDCHGLPAERFTEKKLGINSRQEVIEYGIEKYIVATRENMVQTSSLWEDTIDRIGRWVDFKGAYKTMDKEYMESIWWAFKTLYEKGKIYEGEKVLMYCTLDATPLSKAEVTMDAGAYQDVTDPSVYTKFKLRNDAVQDIKITENSKVLFVCYANVNRSQIAKAVYNHLTSSHNASGAGVAVEEIHPQATTYSAAIEAFETGHEGRARTALRNKYGVDIGDSERHQLVEEDLSRYDLVVDITGENAAPSWLQGNNVVRWDIDDTVGEGVDRDTVMNNNIAEIEARIEKLIVGDIVDDTPTLLAWTTTPWTLPANTALAVNPTITYVEVAVKTQTEDSRVAVESFIVAKDLVETVFTDAKHQPLEYSVLREFTGADLVGKSYEPLFEGHASENAHKIWAADYVTTESGTGIVHIAPAYGEEDFALAREKNIPVVHVLDENGEYTETEWKGANVWEINKTIAKTLLERGVVWKIDYIRHSYPHCHRCGTKLMYRAHPSWFMDVESQREQMLEQNGDIEWFPSHVKKGRFAKTIEQAPDWNISRDRFWATAMPVWKGVDAQGNSRDENGNEYIKVIGSYAELKELSGIELPDYHRPWIDDVTFEENGVVYTRIDKVMDSWFEAGSMPFAQFHYPFENKDKFEANFPGDFIVEYIGQVRAWFYYMHAMSVALFGENSFKNVIVTGNVAGNDGRKMSKSYGNYTDPNELMDKFSADSLRFLLLSSPLLNGEDFALQDKEVGDVARKLSMVWNMYDFFTMYADVDGWEFTPGEDATGRVTDPSDEVTNPLDQWIISRVHQLIQEIETNMDAYDIPNATKPILLFLEDASNWYVRRSRRRFWKSEDDTDKNNAYKTLHYVLVRYAQAVAPFVPFMAEELYRKLTGGESVHLTDWPKAGHVNELVLDRMARTREIIETGLSLRMFKDENEDQIKVRQPLSTLTYSGEKLDDFYESIIAEEVNVKQVAHQVGEIITVQLDKTITPELRREGLAREVVRHVQAARKNAGLNVDDRIELSVKATDDELSKAILEHAATITAETLAENITEGDYAHVSKVAIEGAELVISLEKK
ncbi:MAG: class I tRNA ligase family protein [Candidatus Saccharimonadota bacterium]